VSASLAFDFAQDAVAKEYDRDGRLRVRGARLTKACISDCAASEIPDAAALGLTPSRTYRLYRDPAELRRAIPTFAGCPVLTQHRPVTASDPAPSLVVGAVLKAEWAAPFVVGDLILWTDEAISAVETGRMAQLSAGYRYKCDLTAGRVGGEQYDGVMREISFQHLAIVPEGRVGPECAIDSIEPIIADAYRLLDQQTIQRSHVL